MERTAREGQNPGPPADAAADEFFLAVQRSAGGRAWRDRLASDQARLAMAIAQQLGLPELLGRVLAARGVTPEDAQGFLDPSLRDLLPDPSSLTDMDAAASRIAAAVMQGEQIAIFGDYDVDGASSSALLARFLREVGSDAEIYIPDRIFEGYGPNIAALEGLKERGASLVICVDCGAASLEALGWAKDAGLDVVVLDHHQMGSELPPAVALVNANRQDDLSGQGALAAVGVTFLAVIGVNRELRKAGWYHDNRGEPDLLAWLDLVALGTVCDVVPLTGLNRAFVTKGLLVARRRQNPGLRALADAAGLKAPPDAGSLGYMLGPRINAGGRIGRADLGARLLSESDPEEAARLAATLDRLNSERQEIERATVEEAVAEAEAGLGERHEEPLVLVAGEGWHPGIVGLVASRLKDRFHRPAFAIAFDEKGIGSGSARSVPGVNLGAVVRAAVDEELLEKGGGHAMAAGLTVRRDNLGALRAFLHDRLLQPVGTAHEIDWLRIDGALTAGAVTPDLFALMERAGPFGAGNPEPCFAFPRHRVQFAKVVGKGHLRCTLAAADGSRIGAVAFRAADTPLGAFLLGSRGEPVHVAGVLRLSTWGGRTTCELHIRDAAEVVVPK